MEIIWDDFQCDWKQYTSMGGNVIVVELFFFFHINIYRVWLRWLRCDQKLNKIFYYNQIAILSCLTLLDFIACVTDIFL